MLEMDYQSASSYDSGLESGSESATDNSMSEVD